jgi:hypothetical protein
LKTSTVKDPESLSLPSDSTRATEIFTLPVFLESEGQIHFFFLLSLPLQQCKKEGVEIESFLKFDRRQKNVGIQYARHEKGNKNTCI